MICKANQRGYQPALPGIERKTRHVLVLGAGIVFMSIMLAHAFGRFHGGL